MGVTAYSLASDSFLPHGFCFQWKTVLIWLNVLSDSLVAAAYLVIPVLLFYFAKKRSDLQFRWLFVCFGIFIVACGTTHVMDVVTLWVPAYWIAGVIKCVTALASVPTAVLVARILPQALTFVSAEQLTAANQELEMQSKALRESESSYRDLVEHSQDLICTHDENGILLSVNEPPLKILGYSRDELLNKPLRNFVISERSTKGTTRTLAPTSGAKCALTSFSDAMLPATVIVIPGHLSAKIANASAR